MQFILFIFLFILNILASNENCFKLNDQNVELINENELKIKGTGKMCHCLFTDLTNYKNVATKIIFNNSVSSVGEKCFANFKVLNSIDFGIGIKEIKEGAFYNTKISDITIPNSVELIEKYDFAENKELKTISFEPTAGKEKEIKINDYVFENCNKLTSFQIPKRLYHFESNMFEGCKNLNQFTIESNHQHFKIENNVLFNKNGTQILYYPVKSQNTFYSIPSGVEEIGNDLFQSSLMSEIGLPSTLKII